MGDTITIRGHVIDTSGRSEREWLISNRYDGRIPASEQDWARYGSHQAADLVNADAQVNAARRSAREWVKTVRAWSQAAGYSEADRCKRVAETRKDLFGYYLPAYHRAQAHFRACEAAYQAFLAGQKATKG